MRYIIILLLTFSFFAAFAQPKTEYIKEIDSWHAKREERLKAENGWLSLVGLYWLKEGENTFGSDKINNIVFPKGKADATLGILTLKEGKVDLNVMPGSEVFHKDKPFTQGIIFDGTDESALKLSHKKLSWIVIKRGEKYGIRLWDLESEARLNFTHIDRFPVQEKWKISASYEPAEKGQTIPVVNVLGITTPTPFGGHLTFELDGKKYQLDATLEGNELFIVFADATSGSETYGGGRFLYAAVPAEGKTVILDFNKSYNPPCAFTAFATCPLPPDQNKLALPVTAGEKAYGEH